MSYDVPTVSEFKSYFVRDFPYQPLVAPDQVDINQFVQNGDIQRALDEVQCQINEALFKSQEQFTTGYLLFAAHIMIMNIQSSSQGLSGSFSWFEASKSVGSVSVSQQIPESMLKDPFYAWLSKTGYGVRYLMILMPRLVGAIYTIKGRTLP